MEKVKAYLCQTDWDTDIPMGAQDIKIVTNLKHLKQTRKCVKECGIVEVEIKLKRVVKKGNASWRK